MKQSRGHIDPSSLSIDNTPYEAPRRGNESKYESVFSKIKPGQRLKCESGTANRIAVQFRIWLKANGVENPVVKGREKCEDGFGGVWLMERVEDPKPAPKSFWQQLHARQHD